MKSLPSLSFTKRCSIGHVELPSARWRNRNESAAGVGTGSVFFRFPPSSVTQKHQISHPIATCPFATTLSSESSSLMQAECPLPPTERLHSRNRTGILSRTRQGGEQPPHIVPKKDLSPGNVRLLQAPCKVFFLFRHHYQKARFHEHARPIGRLPAHATSGVKTNHPSLFILWRKK